MICLQRPGHVTLLDRGRMPTSQPPPGFHVAHGMQLLADHHPRMIQSIGPQMGTSLRSRPSRQPRHTNPHLRWFYCRSIQTRLGFVSLWSFKRSFIFFQSGRTWASGCATNWRTADEKKARQLVEASWAPGVRRLVAVVVADLQPPIQLRPAQ